MSADTLRADHLSGYGSPLPISPHLDRLMRSGSQFARATSTSSWTLPTHASMMTGRYPSSHGLRDEGLRLSPDVPTLASVLAENGFSTAGVVSIHYVSSGVGLDRGFQKFDDTIYTRESPVARLIADRLLALVDGFSPPFFAFAHFFDPHWDYSPPAPFSGMFQDPAYDGKLDGSLRKLDPFRRHVVPMPEADRRHVLALYDEEIAYLDFEAGRLMASLRSRGLTDELLVAFIADHGEEFKDHRSIGHGNTLYEEQLAVPLILAGADPFSQPTLRTDLVSPIDLAPTLLDAAGIPAPPGMDGTSLIRPTPDRPLFADTIRFGTRQRSVRWGDYKMIHRRDRGRTTFYHLGSDPGEQVPLRADPTGGRLVDALAAFEKVADRGWHLELANFTKTPMTCRVTARTSGRFTRVRRYYTEAAPPPRGVTFDTFEVSEQADTMRFDVRVTRLAAEVAFETIPPDAPVTFEVTMEGHPKARTYLGRRTPAPPGPLTLETTDPRLAGTPRLEKKSPPGLYIHAVPGSLGTEDAPLTDEVKEHLENLGYIN